MILPEMNILIFLRYEQGGWNNVSGRVEPVWARAEDLGNRICILYQPRIEAVIQRFPRQQQEAARNSAWDLALKAIHEYAPGSNTSISSFVNFSRIEQELKRLENNKPKMHTGAPDTVLGKLTTSDSPEAALRWKTVQEQVRQALKGISERQEQVLELRLKQRNTYEEVARVLEVSYERVRQLEAKIVRRVLNNLYFFPELKELVKELRQSDYISEYWDAVREIVAAAVQD